MIRIGIDLGGTNIAVGAVNERHEIIARCSVPTGAERPAQAVIADMCAAVEEALRRAGLTAADCASIGIGSPGTCDPETGVVARAYNLGWKDVPVCRMLTEHFGLPAHLGNDANCAALAENLLESELFGHERGSFTGADKRRDGRFVQADGGTLFLDEIGEMPLPLQAKLLRALQQGEVQRVGSDTPIHVSVRVIAATNRNLREEVDQRRFREDLYFRLNVITIEVPPLRARAEDIPLLAAHFLQRYAERNRKTIKGFAPQALDAMLRYPWPGNVRELENAVERAVILCTGDLITGRELPLSIATAEEEPAATPPPDTGAGSLAGLSLDELERRAILDTLHQTGDNKSEAARRLGITRATLHNKLRKYGLE